MVPAFFLGRRRYGARLSFPAKPAHVVPTAPASGYGLVWDARIIAANGAAAAGETATVLGAASRFAGNPETGKDPTNPPSLRGTRGVSSKEIPGRLFVWRRSMHAAWMQTLRMFNKINATAVTVIFI